LLAAVREEVKLVAVGAQADLGQELRLLLPQATHM